MLKKTITYTDYDGNTRTEDCRFNLEEVELTRLEYSIKGGLVDYVNKIVADKDADKMLDLLDRIIVMSYGKKSEDGRRFIKTPEMGEEFRQTPAYSVLFMELIRDENAATAFIRGILPANISERISKDELKKVM